MIIPSIKIIYGGPRACTVLHPATDTPKRPKHFGTQNFQFSPNLRYFPEMEKNRVFAVLANFWLHFRLFLPLKWWKPHEGDELHSICHWKTKKKTGECVQKREKDGKGALSQIFAHSIIFVENGLNFVLALGHIVAYSTLPPGYGY